MKHLNYYPNDPINIIVKIEDLANNIKKITLNGIDDDDFARLKGKVNTK